MIHAYLAQIKHDGHHLRSYLRILVEERDVIVSRVSSKENRVDPFTKPLSQIKHDGQTRLTGVRFSSQFVLLLRLLFWYFGTYTIYVLSELVIVLWRLNNNLNATI